MELKSAYAPSASSTGKPINRIGRFHVLRELGQGAIGTVYLAHDPVIDRQVALKTFSPRLSPHEKKQFTQQFINEARAAGRLSHPNIVTIFDASSEGGTTYIAMEYLQGRELRKALGRGEHFSPDDIAALISKIADALAYAHRNGVIHRDIKPANIFVSDDLHPKVVDFGIARAPNRVSAEAQEAEAPYTLFHNNLLGTPHYMSPEQALSRPVDLRTDIYSLGAVMYEMLAHCKPFKSDDTTQLLHQIAYKLPATPHEIDARVPEPLSQIAMKAMSKRPEKRYQQAEEMALDIKRWMAQEKRNRQRIKKENPITDQPKIAKAPETKKPPSWIGWLAAIAMLGALTMAADKLLR